ncbi:MULTISPECIES: chitin-binding protein [unclassified Pseudoalteromonas]|uniref:chitin-binding protein n=1 Tax=unclassified Pseudoalteromonas TaxID=194690 RepID=UPI003869B533
MHTSLACGKWSTIGCLSHHTQLFIGDVVSVTFYDMQGELVSLSFDYKITTLEQGESHAWPRLVAEYINVHIPLVSAGQMTEQGLVVGYRHNEIFALQSSGICKASVDFHCIAKCDERKVKTSDAYDYIYPENSDIYNAGTNVLQPKTGKIYQCKPWPFNEFCRASGDEKLMFEPGVGKSWAMAWLQISD